MDGKIIITGYAPGEDEQKEGYTTTGFTVDQDCSMPKHERAEVLLALASALSADKSDILLFLRLYAAKVAGGGDWCEFREISVQLPKGGRANE